ncbi:hypothetical protein KIW84_043074 [Lathyrus oleraceus]|uniref:Integrase catalytic domain-containing protein n=1 Tax=Pisum sativum TaxID=3888 RepID=A0A9D4XCV3_PEA|nr:hypothetical protein KIW84_043074 [Pisum sativum]
MMKDLCRDFKIEHHNSSPYRPKMNGAVEAANKNIKKIVQKMVVTYKDWHEMLPFALHGYRTSVRTSTGATPYSLVYGMEAVLPVEVEIPSLRVLLDVKLDEAEWIRTRFNELSLIEERRLAAVCHGQLYQRRMKRAFDQKVHPRTFQTGDLVLKRILPPGTDNRGKWTPNYEGPYVVKKVFSGGSLMLTTMDGEDFPSPVNSDVVTCEYFPHEAVFSPAEFILPEDWASYHSRLISASPAELFLLVNIVGRPRRSSSYSPKHGLFLSESCFITPQRVAFSSPSGFVWLVPQQLPCFPQWICIEDFSAQSSCAYSPQSSHHIALHIVIIIASSNCVAFPFHMEHYAMEKFKHMHSCVRNHIRPYPPAEADHFCSTSAPSLLQLLRQHSELTIPTEVYFLTRW